MERKRDEDKRREKMGWRGSTVLNILVRTEDVSLTLSAA